MTNIAIVYTPCCEICCYGHCWTPHTIRQSTLFVSLNKSTYNMLIISSNTKMIACCWQIYNTNQYHTAEILVFDTRIGLKSIHQCEVDCNTFQYLCPSREISIISITSCYSSFYHLQSLILKWRNTRLVLLILSATQCHQSPTEWTVIHQQWTT